MINALWLHPQDFPDSSVGKESTCNAGDPGSISGSSRSTGEGIDYPHQCSWASLVAQLVKYLACNMGAAAATAKLLQSCPTLCDPIDGSPSGSTIPGILQARTLEWVAISFSDA